MQIEIRSDGSALVQGYVNAVERRSRPVMTPHGMVVEEIEAGAFRGALKRAGNVGMLRDHNPGALLAETRAGTLRLYEDNIGLYAKAVIADPKTVADLRAGKAKGWSFGMRCLEDRLEERSEGELPLRRVTKLEMDHVALIFDRCPVYSATSVEVRAGAEETLETRSMADGSPEMREEKNPNEAYQKRYEALRK